MLRISLFFAACLFSFCMVAWADDAKQCQDHPLFSSLQNYEVYACASAEFDSIELPRPELPEWRAPEDYTKVEGRVLAVHYRLQDGATPLNSLQIIRTFQSAVLREGGNVQGEYSRGHWAALGSSLLKYVIDAAGGNSFDRYIVMQVSNNGRNFTVFLGSNEEARSYSIVTIEGAVAKRDVSATSLANTLKRDGFLTFYMNFDDRAILRPDSQENIGLIVALLKSQPDLKVCIEGHTDNTGSPAGNKKLSEDRARAVLAAVFARGIAADRLSAVGRGSEMPIADNRKDDGRALNRRVEVVKK